MAVAVAEEEEAAEGQRNGLGAVVMDPASAAQGRLDCLDRASFAALDGG